MAKGKQIRAEFELPEPILQHIQSFMSGREAAQTTVLSKSWNSAWLKRPNLDLDERYFVRLVYGRLESRFSEFVNRTVQRYEDLNLKIESFKLLWETDSIYGILKELILKVLKMGASDIDILNEYRRRPFIFPSEVFASENLISLSVSGCKIDLGDEGKISCSRLRSLSLDDVYLKTDTIIRNIIWRCPLIEKLSLSNCRIMPETQNPASRSLVFSPFIESGKSNVGSIGNGLSIPHVLHKLKCLFLSEINVDKLFFEDFTSKFPCLKDLKIDDCGGYETIRISSVSLEHIYFEQNRMLRAKFDVPALRTFSFRGSNFPELFFKTSSSGWKSDINVRRCSPPSAMWFLKLNRLLTSLSQSKVSLFLHIQSAKSFHCEGKLQGLPKPEVENLTLDMPCSVYPSLFDCLFRCCRPIYATQCLSRESDFVGFVHKKLIPHASSNCCIANQSMSGKDDPEEVDVEFFDKAISVWRPLLLDALTSQEVKELGIRLRVHFRWGR